jgi:hypothetical protein
MVLLALGILLAVLSLYDHAMIYERARRAHYTEVDSAIKEGRDVSGIRISEKKRTRVCEKASFFSNKSAISRAVIPSGMESL